MVTWIILILFWEKIHKLWKIQEKGIFGPFHLLNLESKKSSVRKGIINGEWVKQDWYFRSSILNNFTEFFSLWNLVGAVDIDDRLVYDIS